MTQVEKAAVRTERSIDAAVIEIKANNLAVLGIAGHSVPRAAIPGIEN